MLEMVKHACYRFLQREKAESVMDVEWHEAEGRGVGWFVSEVRVR